MTRPSRLSIIIVPNFWSNFESSLWNVFVNNRLSIWTERLWLEFDNTCRFSFDNELIKTELSENFQTKIRIDYKYDPDLIGGLTIQVGSVMVDTSIKNKLRQLEKSMIEA